MESWLWVLCAILFVYHFSLFFIKGEDCKLYAPTMLHIPLLCLPLIREGKIFAGNSVIVDQATGGLRRCAFYGELYPSLWLLRCFDVFKAYVIQQLAMALAGFFGMYLLLSRHVLPEPEFLPVVLFVALCFAVRPNNPTMPGVANIPFMCFVFLNLRQGGAPWWNWAVLVPLTLNSDLIFTGFFFLLCASAVFARDWIAVGFNPAFFGGLVWVSLVYLAANYRLLWEVFVKAGVTLARTMNAPAVYCTARFGKYVWIKMAVTEMLHGDFAYARTRAYPLLIAAVGAGTGVHFAMFGTAPGPAFLLLLGFCVATPFAVNFLFLDSFGFRLYRPIYRRLMIDPLRFYTLYPAGWYILFAMSLAIIQSASRYGPYIAAAIALMQCAYLLRTGETRRKDYKMTFRNMVAEKLFARLIEHIGLPLSSYRVASVGLNPEIALYNGMYTADQSNNTVSMEYKNRFDAVMRREYEKSASLRAFYENFLITDICSVELNRDGPSLFSAMAGNEKVIEHLDLDYRILYEMGVRYLLSAVRIREENQPALHFEGKFTHPESIWDVYLYQIGKP